MISLHRLQKLTHSNKNIRIYLCTHNLTFSTKNTNEFAAKYVPSIVERGKYKKWQESTVLATNPQFKIILPPPNITGTLHLGHALTLTIQDVLVRWHKMRGLDTVWVPGMDHAGIATQVVVEKRLWKEKKVSRHDIGREAFEKEIWTWKEEKTGKIRQQIERMGTLMDWSCEMFTMDETQTNAVRRAFIKLFDRGLIYRADNLVNWSCVLRSAISDIEVEHIDIPARTTLNVPGYEHPIEFGTLMKFAYKLLDSNDELSVCTTRPETILGDVALAVHPHDERYLKYHGKYVRHPFSNRQIPIICDEFVDRDFGSGVVKITPAHDPVDFEVSKRHNLPPIHIFDECGVVVSDGFEGLKRFDARCIVVNKLAQMGLLREVIDHAMTVPVCSRSKDIIEYLIKPQWFVDCKEMARKAVQAVKSGELKIEPAVFEKTWFGWLENIHDWCISRQLWWGHRIPAFECRIPDGRKIWVAAESVEIAAQKAGAKLSENAQNIVVFQDNDVLDTWFSSALLPLSAFGWPARKIDPLTLLETGHDILFFWVARMVMLGVELNGSLPFKKILLHGIVCDAHGRKMSKSLGNVIDPSDVINGISFDGLLAQAQEAHTSGILSSAELNRAISGQKKMFPEGIPECGTDALRFTLCSHNIKSHFINFDVKECHTNALFCNKIWQAVKFVHFYKEKLLETPEINSEPSVIDKWIISRLSYMISEINNALHKYDLHTATAAIKQFIYHEFCDVYIETTKRAFQISDHATAKNHFATLILCLERSLRCIAPFMPFIAEELYTHLPENSITQKYTNVHASTYPENFMERNEPLEKDIQLILDVVTVIRRLQKLSNIKTKQKAKVFISCTEKIFYDHRNIIETLSNCGELIVTPETNFKNTVSDTIGDYGVVHIELPGVAIKNSGKQHDRLSKKIIKLTEKIDKMEKMFADDGYRNKAPLDVQKIQSRQFAAMQEELRRLRQLQKSISM